MRAANIIAGVAISLWFALALLGRDGLRGVVAQQVAGYPNIGQINLYIVWPLFVAIMLLACAWLCNAFLRRPWVLGSVSGVSLFAILPYMAVWGGGA
ncbi:hypothetical protein SmB9_19780 [Sphingosinicella microcystinivorans]|uniref:Uncharacterized protein n=1 Tax=Sphingosinicella microcystinivorans TaxID=335406 RepID=A0AAD1D652_SPHMI|nr:hypothetical protein SmB9_19780 [Sphingosinicella microcystinivorans]